MKITIKLIQVTTLILLLFVIIGSINWANRKLPYDGNLATATLRHIGRIVLRDGNRELAQIYDVQITCEQQAPRALACQHQLGQELLTVAVQLRESNSLIEYDCNAQYGSTAVPYWVVGLWRVSR